MEKITWKHRIGLIVWSGLTYGILLFLFDSLREDVVFYRILLQAVLFGVFFGLCFPWIMKKLGKGLSQSIKSPELGENEVLVFEEGANLFRNKFIADGGKLFLTNERLVFVPHKINLKTSQTSIDLKEIQKISPRKSSGIIDNGLRVHTTDARYDFVVNEREKWLENLSMDKPTATV